VDVQMLFDFFSQFGDIYQCKVDSDLYDQYFGQVRGVHRRQASRRFQYEYVGVHFMVMKHGLDRLAAVPGRVPAGTV
jgi:hypothetical protein